MIPSIYNSILDEIQEWILFLFNGDPGSFYTAIFRYDSLRRPGLRWNLPVFPQQSFDEQSWRICERPQCGQWFTRTL